MLGYEQPNRSRRRTLRPPGVCRGHYFRSSSPGRGELAFGRLVSPSTVGGGFSFPPSSIGRPSVESRFCSAARHSPHFPVRSHAQRPLGGGSDDGHHSGRPPPGHGLDGPPGCDRAAGRLPHPCGASALIARRSSKRFPPPGSLPLSLPVLHLEGRPSSSTADAVHACGDRNEIEFSLALSTIRRALSENEYRIVAGDNLWKIAQRVLSQFLPHPPTNQQIAAYWVDLLEANRVTLRSGNPNLIHPNETILLPEIREV